MEKMNDCWCGSGVKTEFIDMPDSNCKLYAALVDKDSEARLFCRTCNSRDKHNHFPEKIYDLTINEGQSWLDLDKELSEIATIS